jgi:hypothetical protein
MAAPSDAFEIIVVVGRTISKVELYRLHRLSRSSGNRQRSICSLFWIPRGTFGLVGPRMKITNGLFDVHQALDVVPNTAPIACLLGG